MCKREEKLKQNMDQLEDEERKSKLTEAVDQFKRLEIQTKDIQDREEQLKVNTYALHIMNYEYCNIYDQCNLDLLRHIL